MKNDETQDTEKNLVKVLGLAIIGVMCIVVLTILIGMGTTPEKLLEVKVEEMSSEILILKNENHALKIRVPKGRDKCPKKSVSDGR